METQLRHSLNNGSTSLRGRLKLSTQFDTVSRTYVNLNTTASKLDIDGYLRQFWCFLGRKHGPVDNRMRLGVGAHYMIGSGPREKVFLGPVLKKEFHFQPRDAGQALSANLSCNCEWDAARLQPRKPQVQARALLNYKVMRFMKRQDIKLTAGSRLFWNGSKLSSMTLQPDRFASALTQQQQVQEPVLRVRENNWSALVEFDDPRAWLGLRNDKSTIAKPRGAAPKARVLISYDL